MQSEGSLIRSLSESLAWDASELDFACLIYLQQQDVDFVLFGVALIGHWGVQLDIRPAAAVFFGLCT